MSKTPGQRLRLMRLKDILFSGSDRDHMLSRTQIEKQLAAYDIAADRKTFYSDLDAIEEYTGKWLIRRRRGKEYEYAVPEDMRLFSLAELKILSDCVLSARFLTAGQSDRFLRKLESLCSAHDAKQLHRQVYMPGKARLEQTEVFDTVDVLNRAIAEDRQVQFHYFNRNVHMEKEYGHGGRFYRVSPWALTWDDGKYYLIGDDMDSSDREIRHYRVDKMEDVELLRDCRSFSVHFEGIRKDEYSSELFGMFSGEERRVELLCENRMAGILIDRFGAEETFIRVDNEHFRTYVKVIDSDQFYAWIISLGKGIKVISPDTAVKKMRAITERLAKTYLEKEEKDFKG